MNVDHKIYNSSFVFDLNLNEDTETSAYPIFFFLNFKIFCLF